MREGVSVQKQGQVQQAQAQAVAAKDFQRRRTWLARSFLRFRPAISQIGVLACSRGGAKVLRLVQVLRHWRRRRGGWPHRLLPPTAVASTSLHPRIPAAPEVRRRMLGLGTRDPPHNQCPLLAPPRPGLPTCSLRWPIGMSLPAKCAKGQAWAAARNRMATASMLQLQGVATMFSGQGHSQGFLLLLEKVGMMIADC